MNNRKGFTLVELLVVIVIIGLLSTLAIVALNSARAKARDAKRVSDAKQVQTALELFFNTHNGYPKVTGTVALGTSAYNHLCAGDMTTAGNNGFKGPNACSSYYSDSTTLMALVPQAPTPPSDATYDYTATDTGDYTATYTIVFDLEESVGNLEGTCTADPSGLVCSGT